MGYHSVDPSLNEFWRDWGTPKNSQVPLTLRDVEIQGFGEEILSSCGYQISNTLFFFLNDIFVSYYPVHMITHTHILCRIHHIFITDTVYPVDLNPLLPLALSIHQWWQWRPGDGWYGGLSMVRDLRLCCPWIADDICINISILSPPPWRRTY